MWLWCVGGYWWCLSVGYGLNWGCGIGFDGYLNVVDGWFGGDLVDQDWFFVVIYFCGWFNGVGYGGWLVEMFGCWLWCLFVEVCVVVCVGGDYWKIGDCFWWIGVGVR